MAIAVGLNTAINDNPSLTVRDTSLFRSSELPARQPVRIVIGDSTKLAAQLSETSNTPTPPKRLKILTPEAPTVITIPQTSANSTEQSLMINTSHNGADRAEFKDGLNELYYDPSQALLPQLLSELYQRQITSLIIEGGADTLTRAIEAGLWDEARVITAPIRLKVGIPAPKLNLAPSHHESVGADTIEYFTNAVATSLSSANPHP
jgi:diaminohydroxyphosphoribosylaminopyrimidine deaminase/5-amino-6-(5-phosphoribosylamino)uracil reductase